MSEGFGLGDGSNDLSGTPGLADSTITEANRRNRGRTTAGRWPDVGTVLRVLLLAVGLIVVVGWVLTAANA
jgi:hypothetical protein